MAPSTARLAAGLLVASVSTAFAQGTDPSGALPYAAAFDAREFLWSTSLAVSPDGQWVAYEARTQPADTNLSDRYQPNGTPSSVVGSKIYLSERSGASTITVCPGGSCWRPAWSPDGSSVAFYSDAGGAPQLWVYQRSSRRARKVSTAVVKAKLWAGDEPRWSPDGRSIYVPLAPEGEFHSPARPKLATTRKPGTITVLRGGAEAGGTTAAQQSEPRLAHFFRENLAAVAAVDVRSGQVRIVVPASATPKPSVLRLSPSGRWVTYLSVFQPHGDTSQVSTHDLAVAPAAGGAVRTVAAELPLLDTDYHRLNYRWHPTEDRLVYLKDAKLWLVDFGPDGPRAPRQLGAALGPLAPTVNWFNRDGRAVVVGIGPRDDKGYGDIRPAGFAVLPLDGGAPQRFTLDDARWTFRSLITADERTAWQPDGRSLTLVLEERATGETGVVRFDPERGGAEQVLWKGVARLDLLTGGGRHDDVFGTYEDYRTPPNVYRFPADFATKSRVSHLDPRLDSVAVGSVEIFQTTVPLYDGKLGQVRTAVLLPKGAKRGDRLPAIVMMYPGGDRTRMAAQFGGGNIVTVPNLVFTSRGYAIVLANLTLGPNREAGNPKHEMVDILLPQVYKAAELGYVDIERLAISGQSFGGYGTAAIISGTNLFRAAVAVSGVYDLPGTYGHLEDDGSSFWVGWSEGGQARMGTHPWANLRRYVDNSPYYQADLIRTPLLIVHGDADPAYHDGQKLFSALRRLDRPVEFASYAAQGHVITEWTRSAAVDAAQRMVGFYRKYLGDPAAGTRQALNR
ncbi:MAG TPA: prolyl oligopeptidase family serine peptidase [Gemmatimonadales bacterium]|nr:prolyl oligopeptidase family serine peptidase [Gemmatimonadales bacterium]